MVVFSRGQRATILGDFAAEMLNGTVAAIDKRCSESTNH